MLYSGNENTPILSIPLDEKRRGTQYGRKTFVHHAAAYFRLQNIALLTDGLRISKLKVFLSFGSLCSKPFNGCEPSGRREPNALAGYPTESFSKENGQ